MRSYQSDREIAAIPDEVWRSMPKIGETQDADLVYDQAPYAVFVSRMSPEDYGYEDWRPATSATNRKAMREWMADRVVIEKRVPGRLGPVRVRRTSAIHSR